MHHVAAPRVWKLPDLWTHENAPTGLCKTADGFAQLPHASSSSPSQTNDERPEPLRFIGQRPTDSAEEALNQACALPGAGAPGRASRDRRAASSSDCCWMAVATPCPCCGPRRSVRRISISSVPCSRAIRPPSLFRVDIRQQDAPSSGRMSTQAGRLVQPPQALQMGRCRKRRGRYTLHVR